MHLIKYLVFILALCISNLLLSQVSGKITDESGIPLSYASIYIQNSTSGTASNNEGDYIIPLSPGNYTLVYQYVGYQTIQKEIILESDPITIDIVLKEDPNTLSEITIAADAEDPAYAIMRKAVANREKNKAIIKKYAADLYIKGLIRVKDAPEKFFGSDLGDMEGILDTNRQGIIYLSESKSKYYFQRPNNVKEVMYASKVAGDANGVSFNQYADANFDMYDEFTRFGRNLVSPLADQAYKFYKYKLVGTFFNDTGALINKIKVIPRSQFDPIYFGHIYIVENRWNIQSVDLSFEGKACKNELFDTINVKQLYVPMEGNEIWPIYSAVLDFSMKVFAFKFNGRFSYFFSDYDFTQPEDDSFFDKEIFKIEQDASDRAMTYWDTIRPIPITVEEDLDYHKKDSLEILWHSETYLDSVDRVENKFTPFNIIFGYTYSKSYRNRHFRFKSPINTFQFNPVEGYKLAIDMRYRQWDEDYNKFFQINPVLNYGFSDKQFRPSINIASRFNSINYTGASLELGRKVAQYNEDNPVNSFHNTYSNLLEKDNPIRLFEKDFVKVKYETEIFNGLSAWVNMEYAQRRPLKVTTQHSWLDRDEIYRGNEPPVGKPRIEKHNAAILDITLRWRIGQRYMTYKNYRSKSPSSWPDILLHYKKGLNVLNSDVDFDFLKLTLRDKRVDLDLWGYLAYDVEIGGFLRDKNIPFMDYHHFSGNHSHLILKPRHLSGFKKIPYYKYSTSDQFESAHLQYHLDGKFMDQIPFFRSTGFKTVLGVAAAQVGDDFFGEYSLGIENIGIGGIPFLRVDYVWSIQEGTWGKRGFTFSLNSVINL